MDAVYILDFPERILEAILSQASYCDLVTLRDVCSPFYTVCSRLLNAGFLRLEKRLTFHLDNVQSEIASSALSGSVSTRSLARVMARYKVLQILDSEYRALRCLCGRQVAAGRYCFTGGDILDHFYGVLSQNSTEMSDKMERSVAVSVAMKCEKFADGVETDREAAILSTGVLFGSAVVDLLDCFLNSNYHLVVTSDDDADTCLFAGCYEVFSSPEGVLTPPPIATDQSAVASDAQMKALLRYLRNAGRWHNLCHCMNTSSRVRRRRLRLCLDEPVSSWMDVDKGDSKQVTKRVMKRSTCCAQDDSTSGMTCAVDLRCRRSQAPIRLTSGENLNRNQKEVPEMRTVAVPSPICYEFSVELKFHYTALEGSTEVDKETVIMIYQTHDSCLMRQTTANIHCTVAASVQQVA